MQSNESVKGELGSGAEAEKDGCRNASQPTATEDKPKLDITADGTEANPPVVEIPPPSSTEAALDTPDTETDTPETEAPSPAKTQTPPPDVAAAPETLSPSGKSASEDDGTSVPETKSPKAASSVAQADVNSPSLGSKAEESGKETSGGGGWGGWGGWGGSLWSSVSTMAESAQAIGQKVRQRKRVENVFCFDCVCGFVCR